MNNIIGSNLRLLRNANAFSQEQVSSFLGINRSTYSNYESGDRDAPLAVLEKVADLFGSKLSLLFEENQKVVENMLTCAFRVDHLTESDLKEVASFKSIVENYLKLNQLLKE